MDTRVTQDTSQFERLASQDGIDRRPVGVLVLMTFLVVDGLKRLAEVLYGLTLTEEDLTSKVQVFEVSAMVSVFWVCADVLLALLLGLRSWAGRLWTQCLFGIHLFYLFHQIAIRSPEGWLYLNAWSRTQIAVSVVIDMAAIVYLSSPRPRRFLAH
ncbi:MAG: hypothetical protein R3F62_04450 [Planctomycetota bacterium]